MLALAVLVASAAVFAWAVAFDWPGMPGSCLVGAGCFCERIRPGAIAQPANTWSSLGFVGVGLWIAWDAARRRRSGVAPRNRIDSALPYASLYAAVVVFLGPGAMYFHAGMVVWGDRLDVLSMYLFIAYLLVYFLARTYDASWRAFLLGYCGLVAILVLDVLVRGGSSVPVFAPLVAVTCTVELLAAIPRSRLGLWRPRDLELDRRFALAAAGSFFAALAIWMVSDTGGPLCRPDSPWQGHAAWHGLAAASAGFLYLYFRSEQDTRRHAPSRRGRGRRRAGPARE